nr:MAG TPA: hypothetical protein [Caudoviricetes sp.]
MDILLLCILYVHRRSLHRVFCRYSNLFGSLRPFERNLFPISVLSL